MANDLLEILDALSLVWDLMYQQSPRIFASDFEFSNEYQ